MDAEFTVKRRGERFTLTVDKLPGRTFGPYDFPEMVSELYVAALISPMEARNVVMEAGANGTATVHSG